MRLTSISEGPFTKWPFFEATEIECTAQDFLRSHQLMPKEPREVDIDSLVMSSFGFGPDYEELPAGVMGCIYFGTNGAQAISLAAKFGELGSATLEHRRRSTLAHEIMHGYLHGPYFSELQRFKINPQTRSEYIRASSETVRKAQGPSIVCRESMIRDEEGMTMGSFYRHLPPHERMAEWQANRGMAALLVPARLARKLMEAELGLRDSYSLPTLDTGAMDSLTVRTSEVFNVSRQLARTRIGELFVPRDGQRDLFASGGSMERAPRA